jgi:hypothetical protein
MIIAYHDEVIKRGVMVGGYVTSVDGGGSVGAAAVTWSAGGLVRVGVRVWARIA